MKNRALRLKNIAFAAGIVLLMAGGAEAALVLTTSTKGTGGALSVDIGGTVTAVTSGTPGTDSLITMIYSVSGLDLSAEEAGATSASFDFSVTYSSGTSDDVDFTGGGNAGVDGTSVGGAEVLTVSVSNVTNIAGFAGTISLDGITRVSVSGFTGTSDQVNFLLSDSSNILLRGVNDTQGGTGVVSDNATILASLGITGFDQSAVFGNQGFRTLRTQFTAVSAVPEPSTFAMCGLGIVGLIARRRRV